MIIDEYYNWLLNRIENPERPIVHYYTDLLSALYSKRYEYRIAMDSNRAREGIFLRYEFGDQFGYTRDHIDRWICGQCSVLELMVALAARCENELSGHPDAHVWFWVMIESLNLEGMDNDHFEPNYVDQALDDFMNGNYKRNGEGGLFTLKNSHRDMRKMELWYQMSAFLVENML
ncbi:MAG: hypothetical protein J6Y02_11750 [Pseudobutyrivibrio sp.]|nr:hypothetical protein [Pseudobutyrivibrio sp.]